MHVWTGVEMICMGVWVIMHFILIASGGYVKLS